MNEDDEFDPEEADRQIMAFIDDADRLPGPSVQRLTDDVEGLVGEAAAAVAQLLSSVPHNKVVATMLLLSRTARTLTPDNERHWHLHAASTLVSAHIIPS